MTNSHPISPDCKPVGVSDNQPVFTHAFTVDVEEWYQVGAFETTLSREEWPRLESRVVLQTENLLTALEKADIRATFFCLGWVAQRWPGLLKKIADSGHEIGCHGMDHRRLFTMNRSQFREDIREAKTLLEQASGRAVTGYRAPSFSLTAETGWAYGELAEAGFIYSSSQYPVKTDHYGTEDIPREPFYPAGSDGILEIPMTVYDTPFRRLPASGGGYFRLLPYWLSKKMFKGAQRQTGLPTMFYMHPWETDPYQPYIKKAPLLSRFRHYTNQRKMIGKIERLFKDFSWGRVDQVYFGFLKGKAP